MRSRVLPFVLVTAGVLIFAGCSTGHKRSAQPARTPATNSSMAAVEPKRDSPEKVERRAEAHAHFLAALSAELNGDTDTAEREYEKSLDLDPSNEQLALDLSRRFIQGKKYDRAIAILQKAADAPEPSALVIARLGLVHLQSGNTNAAVDAYRTAIKKQPGSIAGYQSLYSLYRTTSQTNEARQVLDQAGKLKTPDAAFLVDLSTLYFLEDAPKAKGTNMFSPRAKDALNRAAALNPTNLFVLQKLAQGFRLVGDTKQAAEIYQKLVSQFPDAPGLREELVELLLRSNDTKAAAKQLQALTRDNPTNPQSYYFLGAIAYDEQRYADAVDYYRKALLLKPDFEQLYYDIAAAKIALNEPKEALDYLNQAKRRFTQTFTGEFFSAIARVRMKEFTNALQHFNTAEVIAGAGETNRLTHTFYFQYGSAAERAGKIPEAEKHFEKCLKLSPDFAEAQNYLGYMWAERGTNLARARELIEKAVSQQPTNAAFLDSLGWVIFKQGNAREALPKIQKAIELNKEPDATLYDHLGDIQAALNQPAKARESWKKSLEIEPNKEIEKKLNTRKSAGGT